jgi:hypothetical protein
VFSCFGFFSFPFPFFISYLSCLSFLSYILFLFNFLLLF